MIVQPSTPPAAGRLRDPARLRSLAATGLLDTPAEAAFDRLTEMGSRLLGVPVSLISLVDGDRQFFKSQCGLPTPYDRTRQTPLSHSFCQHVVTGAEPLVVADAREHPLLADNLAIADLGVVAYAGVPLRGPDGEVIGSFCAIDPAPREWSADDVALLHDLAGTAGDIIRLRGEGIAALDAGRRLQEALVGDGVECARARITTLYRPGERRLLLGGDFFSCTEQPDGSLVLLLADVAGHGAEAAAHAILLRSAWSALLAQAGDLGGHVRRLNRIATERLPSAIRFATALFVHVSADRSRARLISAGHPPPVVLDDAGAREVAVAPGPPLGVIADPDWPETEIPLPRPGRFLAYTDGLVEGDSVTGGRARRGTDPLLRLAGELHSEGTSDQALLDALEADARRAHGGPLPDDVAALLLRLG